MPKLTTHRTTAKGFFDKDRPVSDAYRKRLHRLLVLRLKK
jgi:hypothetical protein